MIGRLREWWAEFNPLLRSLPWTLGLLWQSHRGAALAISLVTLLQGVVPVGQLWATKLLVDQIVSLLSLAPAQRTGQALSMVFVYLALEAGVILVGVLLGTLVGHTYNVLGENLSYHVQMRILEQCARLDLAVYESAEYYNQLQRAQEQANYGPMLLLRRLLEFAQAAVTLLSITALILVYKPWLVPILIATTIPGFWVAIHYGRQRFFLFNRRTPDGRRATYLNNVLSTDEYAKEVRIWGLKNYLMDRLQSLRQRFKQENITLSRKQSIAGLGGEIISTLGYYGAYLVVVLGVVADRLTLGDLTLYAGAFSRSQSLFESLLKAIADVYETQLFAQNLALFLSLEPEIVAPASPQPAPPVKVGLRIENLSFTYPETDREVLSNVSLTVRPGECVAIVGANGAGKTTLVKLLLRLYDPGHGSIHVDDVDIRQLDPTELRARIAVVFQDYARYQLTARENVGFGKIEEIENLEKIRRVAQEVGIHSLLGGLPGGYETLLGRRFEGGHELSLGQWQRVAVARALLRDAPLLILDEPTAALDAQAEYELYQQLKDLARNRMTILISHRFSTVRMADRIIVLDNGRIIEEGTHEELLAQDTQYAYFFKLQAESYQIAPPAAPAGDDGPGGDAGQQLWDAAT
jgi:ATP-binding cassette subfamily B protein